MPIKSIDDSTPNVENRDAIRGEKNLKKFVKKSGFEMGRGKDDRSAGKQI